MTYLFNYVKLFPPRCIRIKVFNDIHRFKNLWHKIFKKRADLKLGNFQNLTPTTLNDHEMYSRVQQTYIFIFKTNVKIIAFQIVNFMHKQYITIPYVRWPSIP